MDYGTTEGKFVGGTDQRERVPWLVNQISPATYDEWSSEREFRRNIREGRPWLNTPPPIKPADRHSPSQLHQCHRKIYYRQLNAPEESEDPSGIFWSGTKFEEELMMPYLESIISDDVYVRNSMWVDYTLETEHGELYIRGETDPVIVDEESQPILLTEIKTKQSINDLDEPNDHHLAQVYAYLEGLSREWEEEVRDALIIYGSRTSLDIKPFHVRFDPNQWDDFVLDWATRHTEYRLKEELPPANPEYGWECKFCSYKHRCGKAEKTDYQDSDADGLLPFFEQYPKEKVAEYLEIHDEAKLLPTLAYRFPDLADRFETYEWRCQRCPSTYEWDTLDWKSTDNEPPYCPSCLSDGVPVPVREPSVEEQSRIDKEMENER